MGRGQVPGSVEEWCRRQGLGVIHGGSNALRFTPHFAITSDEIDMIIEIIRQALEHFATIDQTVEAESPA